MSQSSSAKAITGPSAIDVYDERVRKLIELWKEEIAGMNAREQSELEEWRREQRKWTGYWSGSGGAGGSVGGEIDPQSKG